MTLELSSLKKAITSLQEIIFKTEDEPFMEQLDEIAVRGLQAGVIQNFEFTYELSWKYMKRWLAINIGNAYVDGISRKELFRISAENLLIADVAAWLKYHEARNITSHTYNENTALEVFAIAKEFLQDAQNLYQNLEAKND